MAFRRIPVAAVLTAAAAVALGGAVAPSASAAAPWTAPQTVPGAAPTPAPPIFTGDGRGLASPASDRTAAAPAGSVTEIVPLDPATGAPNGAIRGLGVASAMAVAYAR